MVVWFINKSNGGGGCSGCLVKWLMGSVRSRGGFYGMKIELASKGSYCFVLLEKHCISSFLEIKNS